MVPDVFELPEVVEVVVVLLLDEPLVEPVELPELEFVEPPEFVLVELPELELVEPPELVLVEVPEPVFVEPPVLPLVLPVVFAGAAAATAARMRVATARLNFMILMNSKI